MQNDAERILKLYALFERYGCNFELLCAADINTLDVVQAVITFKNVYAGGLWWMNFRPSVYKDMFEKRFEAIPACRSLIFASDAYNIQWCYGKIKLVKKLLADFLASKVETGFIDPSGAAQVAYDWLFAAGMNLYKYND